MEFHSARFGVFLAVVLVAYWLLANRRDARYLLLLAGSYVFYAAWETWFLALIVFSSLLDYACGRWIHSATDPRQRGLGLLVSLAGNLGVLGYFKYSGWGVDGLQRLFDALGFEPGTIAGTWAWQDVVPVGISFYTFQTLSYTIDIYRGALRPARNLREFGLFVAFFPQLVAGPIVRAAHFLPQLDLAPRFDRARLHDGLYRIALGIGKKVLLADQIGRFLVDPVYATPEQYAPAIHVLALYGFAFQIYCDFSGYSDVAIGAARLLGFDLPENFLKPFRSRSVREFWRRWHVTLSSWVRDYVYIPLGGSRRPELIVARNLVLTMLIIAVWHGASMLWVYYGLLQGGAMVLERVLERRRGGGVWTTTPARSFVAWVLTFQFVAFTLFFVRAETMDQFGGMFRTFGESTDLSRWAWITLGFAALTHLAPERWSDDAGRALRALPTTVGAVLLGAFFGGVAYVLVGDTPFIYFQF